jgi:integrase
MARKPPDIEHVKHVYSKRMGRWYSYFNSGRKNAGKPIRTALPEFGTTGFWDSYASCLAGRNRIKTTDYTVADLVDEFLASTEYADKADNTQKNYRVQSVKIKAAWGKFPVDSLEPSHVRAVLDREEWGAGTRNMVTATLGVVYRWARRRNKAKPTTDPVKDIERADLGEHEPWPDDVLEAALQSDDPMIRLAVHLLYFTGQRIGDVCKMRWGDIRDSRVFVRQTKTGKVVEPPLATELRAELDRHAKDLGPIIKGATQGQIRRKLQAFTRLHGIETVPHGLRKNAVNALLEAGCTIAEVSAITGQTHQIVEKYAARVNRRKLGDSAVVKMEAARGKSA